MTPPRALITGITGQDGSYLAEFLLDRGYQVHGMVRRSSTEKFERIEQIRDRLELHQGDLLDQRSLVDTLRAARPDEIYNLAAMSYVAASWVQPTLTAEFTGIGVTRLLESMRGTTGHIFNLGHGILPQAKLECVEALVGTVTAWA